MNNTATTAPAARKLDGLFIEGEIAGVTGIVALDHHGITRQTGGDTFALSFDGETPWRPIGGRKAAQSVVDSGLIGGWDTATWVQVRTSRH